MVSKFCLICGSTYNCQTLCLGARPRYNPVVDENFKKSTKQTNKALMLGAYSATVILCAAVFSFINVNNVNNEITTTRTIKSCLWRQKSLCFLLNFPATELLLKFPLLHLTHTPHTQSNCPHTRQRPATPHIFFFTQHNRPDRATHSSVIHFFTFAGKENAVQHQSSRIDSSKSRTSRTY